ncbi:NAD-dependent epimerase/dehydratase family protein [Novosphingobium panipatense]|uniref:NAD-dependent epimerase/dehydratase family protein n=1 Tax=Novosphingobium panipatense TaxID=428991 RepID=UPI00360A760C
MAKGGAVRGSVSLVTGAAGFIGSHLTARLVARGDDVHVVLRPGSNRARLLSVMERVTVHELDLADRSAVRAAIRAACPNRVFHLGAETRLSDQPAFDTARKALPLYVEPAFNLVEELAALPDPPFIVIRAGTIAEYGQAETPYRETGQPLPLTPYGAGMLAATHGLSMLAPILPFPVITARLALCYGPGQSRSFFVPALVDALLSRRSITVARPEDRRDLMHVTDAVEGLLRLADFAPADCELVNLATGMAPTMREVAERVVAQIGCPASLVSFRTLPPGDVPTRLLSSPDRANRRFGWRARIGLEDGLRATIEAEQAARELLGHLP